MNKNTKSKRLIITVHGIRTFGEWQGRLEKLIDKEDTDDNFHIHSINYGYFSIFSFLIPFARYIAVWRIRKQIWKKICNREWSSVDIVAHSFGTYLAAYSIKYLQKQNKKLRIRTVILAGSVLPPKFPWNEYLLEGDRPCISRVVNDCGTKDNILILSQLFVPFSSLAGRTGFQGGINKNFRNRYFPFGHSGYFMSNGKTNDFMEVWWLPLLLENSPIEPHDSRENKLLSGPITFLINHAELFKQSAFVSIIYFFVFLPVSDLMLSEEYYRAETSKHKLLLSGETNPAYDYRLLAALELERRGYWNEAKPLLENTLKSAPKVKNVVALDVEERIFEVSSNLKYMATYISEQKIFNVREIATGKIIRSQVVKNKPKILKVKPNGEVILAGFVGNKVWYSINNNLNEYALPNKTDIKEILLSDTSMLLAVRHGSSVDIINISSGEKYPLRFSDYVDFINFSADGNYLVSFVNNDEFIYVYKIGNDYSTKIITRNNPLDWYSSLELRAIFVSSNGKFVAGINDTKLFIWSMVSGEKILDVNHEQNIISSNSNKLFTFDRLSKTFIMANEGGKIKRWVIGEPHFESIINHMDIQGKLFKISQDIDGRLIFIGQRESRIIFWQETDWVGDYEDLRCSDNGEYFATVHKNDGIRIWGSNGYPFISNVHLNVDKILDFALSESDNSLTMLMKSGEVTVSSFSDSSKNTAIKVKDHNNYKRYKSALSKNGRYAAFALGDRKIWSWDVYSSSVVGSVYASIGERRSNYLLANDIFVSCDGRSVRIVGKDCDDDRNECTDVDRQWTNISDSKYTSYSDWDDKCNKIKKGFCERNAKIGFGTKEQIIKEARSRITRNFTHAEWVYYFGDEPYQTIDSKLP